MPKLIIAQRRTKIAVLQVQLTVLQDVDIWTTLYPIEGQESTLHYL